MTQNPKAAEPPALHAEMPDGGAGVCCLFIHGLMSSRVQWRLNLDALTSVCRPVVVELWGHGRSPAPRDPAAYSIEGYIAAFETLRAQLGLDSWFVCGQSFGAGLALHYALRHPGRVIGVAFTNSISAMFTPNPDADRKREAWASAVEHGGAEAVREIPFHPRFARRFPDAIRAEMLQDAALIDPGAITMALRHTMPALSVLQQIGDLSKPVLLINGRLEAAFQPLRDRARREMPGIEVVDLEGGHSVNIDCAERFNEALIAFVRKHAMDLVACSGTDGL